MITFSPEQLRVLHDVLIHCIEKYRYEWISSVTPGSFEEKAFKKDLVSCLEMYRMVKDAMV